MEGGARFRLLAVVAAAVGAIGIALLVALGATSRSVAQRTAYQTSDPVAAFAPLAYLHASEDAFPLSAHQFIQYSTLKWRAHDCYIKSIAIGRTRMRLEVDREPVPIIKAARLGNTPGYKAKPSKLDTCVWTDPTSYSTVQHVRPFDRKQLPGGLEPGDGFYFDLLTLKLPGRRAVRRDGGRVVLDEMPVYYQRQGETIDGEPGMRITYWFLYGRNSPPGSPEADMLLGHEGDWERIDVLVQQRSRSQWAPVSVRFHANDEVRTLDWSEVERTGVPGSDAVARPPLTHPVIYIARGTHTPYPAPRNHQRVLEAQGLEARIREEAASCPKCPEWRTWENLIDVREEPWYGYGGGWGFASTFSANSGPPGPSPYTDQGLSAPTATPPVKAPPPDFGPAPSDLRP